LKSDLVRSIKLIRQALSKKQKNTFILAGFLTFIHSILDLLGLALLFGTLSVVIEPSSNAKWLDTFNRIFKEPNQQEFYLYMFGALFVLFLIKNIGSYFSKRFQVRFAFEVAKDLSDALYEKQLNRGVIDQKKESTGELNHRINSVAIYFSDFVMLPTLMIIAEMLLACLIMITVLVYSTKLFLFMLLFIIPAAYFIGIYSKRKLRAHGNRINHLTPKLYSNTQTLLHGFVELKLAGKEKQIQKEFEAIRSQLHASREKIFMQHSVVHTHFMETIVVLGVFTLALITYLNPEFGSLASSLVLFGTMAFRLIPSLNRIITSNNTLRTFSYVLDMIQTQHEDVPVSKEEIPVSFKDKISFENVSFTFPNGHPVLQGLSFQVKKGEKIGIYGASGSGKTTLINLLMGFYPPKSGSIHIDSTPLSPESIPSWQHHLGYVRQDSFISDGTVLENVAFGYSKDDIDYSKVERCIRDAKLSSWVHSLPKGLDTPIGELGNQISGGQRQRIAIARMLYKEAELLILDEITNSLDHTTSAEVLNMVYHLNNSKSTIVMISHQPEEFHTCDRVYKLQAGQLVEIND